MLFFPLPNISLLILWFASIYSINSTDYEEIPQQQSLQSKQPLHLQPVPQPPNRTANPHPNEAHGIYQPTPDFPPGFPMKHFPPAGDHSNLNTESSSQAAEPFVEQLDFPLSGEFGQDWEFEENFENAREDQINIEDLSSPFGHDNQQTSSSAMANTAAVAELPEPSGRHGKQRTLNPSNAVIQKRGKREKMQQLINSANSDLKAFGINTYKLAYSETIVKYREYILWLENQLFMHREQIRKKVVGNQTLLEILDNYILNANRRNQPTVLQQKRKTNDVANEQESKRHKAQASSSEKEVVEKPATVAERQKEYRLNMNEAVRALYATLPELPHMPNPYSDVDSVTILELALEYKRILQKYYLAAYAYDKQTVPDSLQFYGHNPGGRDGARKKRKYNTRVAKKKQEV